MNSYVKSRTPSMPWNGDELGLIGTTTNEFIRNHFNNKDCAALVALRNDGSIVKFIAPAISDKIVEDAVVKNYYVVGNGFDDTNIFCPVSTDLSVFRQSVTFMEKDDVPPIFKTQKALKLEYLVGTKWEGKKNIIATFVPNALPIQFGSNLPSGFITDDDVQTALAKQGGEPATWGMVMKNAHAEYDDTQTVLEAIKADKKETAYISPDYGEDIRVPTHSPYTTFHFVEDPDECPDAIEKLKEIFGAKPKSTPKAPEIRVEPNIETVKTLVLQKPEDEEKLKVNERSKDILSLLFACGNVSFNDTSKPLELEKPEFTDSFAEILSMKGDSLKIAETQCLIESAFSDELSLDLDECNNAPSGVKTARSLIHFSKTAAGQLLKGAISTKPINSLHQDNSTLGPSSLFYQSNQGNKVDILKDAEAIQEAEETHNVPENQRTERKATIAAPGCMANLDHALGLMANICVLITCLVKIAAFPGKAKPVLYTVIMALFNFCSGSEFKRWYQRFENEHPFGHVYLYSIVETVWNMVAKGATTAPNPTIARTTGSFANINKNFFRAAIIYAKAKIDELRTCMLMDVAIPQDKAPKITPLQLDPKKQTQLLLARLQGEHDNSNTNGGGGGQRGSTKRSANGEDKENTNANGNNTGGAGGGGKGRSKRPPNATRATVDRKTLGLLLPDSSKPAIDAKALFGGLGLANKYCMDFMLVGRECPNQKDCDKGKHVTITKMDADDRKKIFDKLVESKAAFLNPSMKGNSKVMELLDDAHKKLFPSKPSDGASKDE